MATTSKSIITALAVAAGAEASLVSSGGSEFDTVWPECCVSQGLGICGAGALGPVLSDSSNGCYGVVGTPSETECVDQCTLDLCTAWCASQGGNSEYECFLACGGDVSAAPTNAPTRAPTGTPTEAPPDTPETAEPTMAPTYIPRPELTDDDVIPPAPVDDEVFIPPSDDSSESTDDSVETVTDDATGQDDSTSVTDDSTGDATDDSTGDATDDSAGEVTDDSTGDATDDSTGGVTDDSTGDATDDSTGDATDDSTGDVTDDSTGGATDDSTGDATDDFTGGVTDDSTGGYVPPACPCIRCEDFPVFNVLTEEGVNQEFVDIEGTAAVCGDLDVAHFGIGVSVYDDVRALLVGGDINWQHGTVYGQTEYGGEATVDFVNFMYGAEDRNSAASEECAGHVSTAKTLNKQLTMNTMDSGAYESPVTTCVDTGADSACHGFGHSCVFDVANGDKDEDTGIVYMAVTATELAACSSIVVSQSDCTDDVIEFAVIDVIDDQATGEFNFGNGQFYSAQGAPLDRSNDCTATVNTQTVWNFYGFTSIHMDTVSWKGAIVAPTADMTTGYHNIEGNVYVKSLNGNVETHYFPVECPPEFDTCTCETAPPTPAPSCPCIEQEDFPFFNVVIEGDYTSDATDVEGSMAVGGNLMVSSFSAGTKLGRFGADWTNEYSLLVGGEISWDSGSLFNGVAGINNGQLLNTANVDPFTGEEFSTAGFLAGYMHAKSVALSELLATNAAEMHQVDYQAKYGWQYPAPVTLTALDQSGKLIFDTADASVAPIGVYYFEVTASLLQTASEVDINKELGQFVVINVVDDVDGEFVIGSIGYGTNEQDGDACNEKDGDDVAVENYSDDCRSLMTEVVWNFYDFSSVQMGSWYGSVLAPTADVTSDFSQILGTLYAKSFSGTAEFHWWPSFFDGECVCPTEEVVEPEPEPVKCYDTCEEASIFTSRTCAAYADVIANGCGACNNDAMTEYMSLCLEAGCDAVLDCGAAADEVTEVEVTNVVVEYTVTVEGTEDEIEEVQEQVEAAITAASGQRSCSSWSNGTEAATFDDGIITVHQFAVDDVENWGGSGVLSSQLENDFESTCQSLGLALATGDRRRLSASFVPKAGTTVTVKTTTSNNADYSDNGSSSSSSGAATVGIVAGLAAAAVVAGVAVTAQKKGYFHNRRRSASTEMPEIGSQRMDNNV